MSAATFLSNVAIICAAMAAFALLELIIPLWRSDPRRKGRAAANFALSAITLLLNWALISGAAVLALWLGVEGHGLLATLALPLWGSVAIAVVALDFSTWVAHVALHKIGPLWALHRVHHSDVFLDVSTTLRQHPLEGVWRALWMVGPVWALGLPAKGVVLYRLLSVLQGIAEHANIGLWRPLDRIVSLAWVTPDMHKVHHSNEPRETDSNYGNLLAVFDRLFGVFTPSARGRSVVYGLREVPPDTARSLAGLLLLPFGRLQRGATAVSRSGDMASSP